MLTWRISVTLVSVLVFIAARATAAYAGQYTSQVTGYAFGNQNGSSGYTITQGDFANHGNACPNDPASSWSFGTTITMVNPSSIALYDENGTPTNFSNFGLWDTGDPGCSEPNYWVDIYFGRYQFSGCACDCPGSPSGLCIFRNHNNCQDALDFGSGNRTYNGP